MDAASRATQLETLAVLGEIKAALPAAPITELSRTQFYALGADAQTDAVRRGVRITNDGPAPRAPLGDGQIRRGDFDRLSAPERHRLILGGKIVVD